jgi:ATP-dependent RNA helicase RhlE
MPDTVDAYTHRIGRTGRAEETGEAFTFAMPEDATMVRDIEKVLGERLEKRQLADFNYGEFNPKDALQLNGRYTPSQPTSKNNNRRRRRYGSNRNGRH